MRIFVTGATGFIGSAVVSELIEAGHQVVGLARSDKAAESLTAVGATVHRGALDDLDSLHKGAAASDGVIHLGFKTDFADFAGAVATDLHAVETFGAALEGSNKPFVFTTGTLVVAWSNPVPILGTEETAVDSNVPRGAAENAAIALADRGIRSSVVRLAPTVHGPGDHGFISMLIDIARKKGSRPTSATGPTAGKLFIASMRLACTVLQLNPHQLALGCTLSAKKVFHSVISLTLSVAA